MDDISEVRLQLVNPKLADKVRDLAVMLETEGIIFRVTQGIRSWSEQQALYAQGRETLDQVNELRAAVHWPPLTTNNKVTNAPPGHSWHNFGLAVDVVPDDPTLAGFQADWNVAHPAWGRIVSVAATVGLVNGISWKDEPHLQLTGRFPVSPDDEVRQLFTDGGIQAVWDEAQL